LQVEKLCVLKPNEVAHCIRSDGESALIEGPAQYMPSVGEILVMVVRSPNFPSRSINFSSTEISPSQSRWKSYSEDSIGDISVCDPLSSVSLFYRPEAHIPTPIAFHQLPNNVVETYQSHQQNASVNPYSSYIQSNQWSYYDRTSLPQRLEL